MGDGADFGFGGRADAVRAGRAWPRPTMAEAMTPLGLPGFRFGRFGMSQGQAKGQTK